MAQESVALVLSRAELVYVLNALQATKIIGVDLSEFDLPPGRFQTLLQDAEQSLVDSSLLTVEEKDQKRLLDPGLVGLVGALPFCSLAFVLVRGVRGQGQQMFIHNFYEDIIVEHTLPQEGLHRLAAFDSLESFFARVDNLVPLKPVIVENRPQLSISESGFEELRQSVQAGEDGKAQSRLTACGLEEDLAPALLQALRDPLFTLSLACLECEKSTVINAHSLAVFADEQSAWGIWQETGDKDDPDLLVLPTGINDVRAMIISWLGLAEEEETASG